MACASTRSTLVWFVHLRLPQRRPTDSATNRPGEAPRETTRPDGLAWRRLLSLPDASPCSRVRGHTPVDCLGPAAAQSCRTPGSDALPPPPPGSRGGLQGKIPPNKNKNSNTPPRSSSRPDPLRSGQGADSGLKAELVPEAQPRGRLGALRHPPAASRGYPRRVRGVLGGPEGFPLPSGAANRDCGAPSPSLGLQLEPEKPAVPAGQSHARNSNRT